MKVASRSSVPDAQYYLSLLYQSGHGVPKDIVESCRLSGQAAEAGYPDALVIAGVCLEEGLGAEEDLPEAIAYFREAAEEYHDSGAQVSLARLIINNQMEGTDYGEAVQLLEAAAPDNPAAALLLGDMYFQGLGVDQDNRSAVKWYEEGLGKIDQIGRRAESDWYLSSLDDSPMIAQAHKNLATAKNRLMPELRTDDSVLSDQGTRTKSSKADDKATEIVSSFEEEKEGHPVSSLDDNVSRLNHRDDGPQSLAVPQTQAQTAGRNVELWSESMLTTFPLLLGSVLMGAMLFYPLSYLAFKKALGLTFSAAQFSAGFGVTLLLLAVIRLVVGEAFYRDKANALVIPVVASVLVLIILLLLQRRTSTNYRSGPEKDSADIGHSPSAPTSKLDYSDLTGLDKDQASTNCEEVATYERAWVELENGEVKTGLWAQCFAESGGDQNKTKAAYLRARVQQLNAATQDKDRE